MTNDVENRKFDTKYYWVMSTAELKIDIINKIATLKEVRIIEEIQKLLDFELNKDVFQLNAEQRKRMTEAQQEYKTAKILTAEQADKDIDEWLNEK